MEVETLLWPLYEALVFSLLRSPPRSRCNGKCRCAFFAALFAATVLFLVVAIISLHVAHVGTAGCMPDVLSSLLSGPNTSFTEEDVFRFHVATTFSPPYASSDPDFQPDYIWSGQREGVTLGQASRVAHGFRAFNFTLPLGGCPGAAGSFLDALYSPAVMPPDTPVVNAAMFGRRGATGYLVNARTGEDWSWGADSSLSSSVLVPSARGAGMSLLFRTACVLNLLLGFFLMSTVTALLFRLFVLSMPAFMYPVLALVQRCVPTARADPGVIDGNFPWLGSYALAARLQDAVAGQPFDDAAGPDTEAAPDGGAPDAAAAVAEPVAGAAAPAQQLHDDEAHHAGLLPPAGGDAAGGLRQRVARAAPATGPLAWLAAALSARRQNQPRRMPAGAVAAIAWAHVQQLFLVSMAYEGVSYVVGALMLTFKSYPNNLSVVLWLTMLVAEAFSAVYVRSLLAMTLFPRACFVLYAAFYYYYVAFAYPYSMLAAVALLFAVLALMLCSVLFLEVPAYGAGRVSVARPRAVVVLLPTAIVGQREPPAHWAAPPLWSLFMPVTYRPPAPVNAYDVPVPPPPVHADDFGAAVAGDAQARLLGAEEAEGGEGAMAGGVPQALGGATAAGGAVAARRG